MKWTRDIDNAQHESLNRDHSASTEELARIYGMAPGTRIHSVYHRAQPSALSSTTSSSASVATNAGSTAALLHTARNKKKNRKNQIVKLNGNNHFTGNVIVGKRKEHSSLLASASPVADNIFENVKKKKERQKKISMISQKELWLDVDSDTEYDDLNAHSTIKYKFKKEKPDYLFTVLASITVSLGSCAVGFATAYTSPALPSMNATESTLHVTTTEGSWIGSLMPLFALIGGIIGGPLIETAGRRSTILSTALPFIISFLLIALAVNVPMVFVGRSIAGFCVGICSLALPVYLGETVQPEVRGTLGLLPTTLGNTGILLCFVAGKYLDWRLLAFLGAAVPVPFLVCMFLIPETPQWYISRSNNKKAKESLQWLRGQDADITQEFDEIEKSNQLGKGEEPPTFSTIFQRMYMKPLFISIGLMFFQQLSGINAVIFYTVRIFEEAGSSIDKNDATIIIGVVNFCSTFVATVLIDRLGRKILLYSSSITMVITLTALGTFFYFKSMKYDVLEYGWVPLVSFVIFVIGFSIGFGPIPWLMMGEILPAKIRGSAASLATAFNWSCTFVVTKTFTDITDALGTHGAFWIFASISFVGLIFVILCVPETQGKSLEDIERNLTGVGKVPVRQVRRMSSIAHLRPLPMAV